MVNSFCSNLFLHHTRTSFTDNLSTPRKNNSFSVPTAILFLPFWHIISSILYARSTYPVFGGILNIIVTSRHKYLDVISLFSRNCRISARSSRPEVFCEKGVLRNFTKFTGKHLCQSLSFNKVAGLRPATSLKKRLWDLDL